MGGIMVEIPPAHFVRGGMVRVVYCVSTSTTIPYKDSIIFSDSTIPSMNDVYVVDD